MASLVQIAKKGESRRERDTHLLVVGGVNYRKRGDLAWKEGKEQKNTLPKDSKESFSPDLLAHADIRGSFRSRWGPLPATKYESTAIVDMHDEAFAERVWILLKDPDLRARMGNRGCQKIVRKYGWKNNVRLVENCYRKITLKMDKRGQGS